MTSKSNLEMANPVLMLSYLLSGRMDFPANIAAIIIIAQQKDMVKGAVARAKNQSLPLHTPYSISLSFQSIKLL